MVMRFEELDVWKKACRVAISVYKLTSKGRLAHDFALRDQMRRSVVSIPSNIAEGKERETVKELIRYLYIAKGSVAELKTQLFISCEIKYLDCEDYNKLEAQLQEVSAMLGSMIRTLKRQRDRDGEKIQ
jgi:four helix bundle protein